MKKQRTLMVLKCFFGIINTLAILIVLLFHFQQSGCLKDEDQELDESIFNVIESFWNDDEPSHIIYQGKRYNYAGRSSFLRVGKEPKDILLSRNGTKLYGFYYYSDTKNSPLFIYQTRNNFIYLREDYDYFSDNYMIESTLDEIVLSDIFTSKGQDFYGASPTNTITLRSKTNSRITIILEVICKDNDWYVRFGGKAKIWKCSEPFLDLLKRNNLLTQ